MIKTNSFSKFFAAVLTLLIVSACATSTQQVSSVYYNEEVKSVEAKRFDNGKMWTFEDAPVEYFEETYNFKPSGEWLDKVRMSSLKFAAWCSASFVSGDGLVMTNHHCVDFISDRIQEDGENIYKNGFYANTLEEERQIPNVWVNQLAYIEDVTDRVQTFMDEGKTEEERSARKDEIINELVASYNEETGLNCRVVPLYNGGKYSLYGYRRYNDVRAVFIAESEIGLYGGDPDNFTFPRYNCDFAFVRVYDDNGNPLKTDNFFKWSPSGPVEDEPLFVIGRPGSTERIKTVAQYVYMRDVSVKNKAFIFSRLTDVLTELIADKEKSYDDYNKAFMLVANSAKVFENEYKSLKNNKLIARKVAFEDGLKKKAAADPLFQAKYGHIWAGMEDLQNEKSGISPYISSYGMNPSYTSDYFFVAKKVVEMARELAKPEADRAEMYNEENLDNTITSFFEGVDTKYGYHKLAINAETMELNFGADSKEYKEIFGSGKSYDAADFVLANSFCDSETELKAALEKGYSKLLESDDRLIRFYLTSENLIPKKTARLKEINVSENVLEEELGRLVFAVYGTDIPPDATFTLRISDGVMKGFNYNGTVAPDYTTLYGLYDRYFSHKKEYPWDLPQKWLDAVNQLDLSKPLNFVSTHDITGGSSGSPVINKKAEVVGIAFDGNIESIAGSYLYDDEYNRMVSVHSEGMVEVLEKVYGGGRIVKELRAGKIVKEKAPVAVD
ncbi:MAG: hypothetical protein SCALA702_15650 [Melioribacteraceae bacterium]|nr:MAG: hypothetical protein SCALA702_15650 [Melioribacteraceae bacterium]